MKIAVASDIHLEFGDCFFEDSSAADVLILGGDICVAADIGRPDHTNFMEGARSDRIRDFFRRCARQFPHVIYIMGNHEHYHGDFSRSQAILEDMITSEGLQNVYLLEKATKIIDGWTFIGGTLWTDFNGSNPVSMLMAKEMMNDFRGVKHTSKGQRGGDWRFLPQDALEDHQQMTDYLRRVIDDRRAQGDRSQRVIVVGHHAPSEMSVHDKYKHDRDLNGAFRTQLDDFILDRPEIALWTHGHTHEDFDYTIGNTRIVCNPRGYVGHESRTETWQLKYVELV